MRIEYLFFAFAFPLILIVFVVYNILLRIWYRRNYMTYTGQFPPYWHKCWDCKKVEGNMFYSYTFWAGKIFRCSECSCKSYKKSIKDGN